MSKKQNGPGKSYRKGMSLVEAVNKFSDEKEAERWFVQTRWPDGLVCVFCGSLDDVYEVKSRKPQAVTDAEPATNISASRRTL